MMYLMKNKRDNMLDKDTFKDWISYKMKQYELEATEDQEGLIIDTHEFWFEREYPLILHTKKYREIDYQRYLKHGIEYRLLRFEHPLNSVRESKKYIRIGWYPVYDIESKILPQWWINIRNIHNFRSIWDIYYRGINKRTTIYPKLYYEYLLEGNFAWLNNTVFEELFKPVSVKLTNRVINYTKRKWRNWFDLNYTIDYKQNFRYKYRWKMLNSNKTIKTKFNTKLNTIYPSALRIM
jgi:hypothetical protein